jgi:tetratricopeptide (TPR) repeat protein
MEGVVGAERHYLEPSISQSRQRIIRRSWRNQGIFMGRSILTGLTLAATWFAALLPSPVLAQQRPNIGLVCTSDNTPADKQIDACTKIIALKAFSGEKLADIYFWRAVGWNKKGDYTRVIADTTEGLRHSPKAVGLYNLRGSAYYDKGEYDIAIADFNDAVRLGGPHTTILHNRGNAYRNKHDYPRALADYSEAIRLDPKEPFPYQNRGIVKLALGDLDGALTDLNEAIRLRPSLASTYINRGVLFRAKGEFDRAIADTNEAIRLLRASAPANIMTPPGSVWISAHVNRGFAYEAKGDYDHAKQDFKTALDGTAADAGSKANQVTAKVRLELLSKAVAPPTMRAGLSDGGRRVALVIGNGAYAHVTALPNPANDARSVARNLRDLGFDVSEGIDLDRAAMKKTADEFLLKAAQAQTALLYYAGHGIQVDGRNYLVPVDVQLQAGVNLAETMTDMDTILAGLNDQVRTNILIFDACRNNPIDVRRTASLRSPMAQQTAAAGPGRALAVVAGLAAPSAPASGATRGAGTLIAFATAPGQVALDGEGANSPFSAALSRHIGTPGLELQQMLTRVRAEVVAGTKGQQVPWSNSSLLGEVFLAAKP